jgi:hypothetical protein
MRWFGPVLLSSLAVAVAREAPPSHPIELKVDPIEDTLANRRTEAKRYLEIMPVSGLSISRGCQLSRPNAGQTPRQVSDMLEEYMDHSIANLQIPPLEIQKIRNGLDRLNHKSIEAAVQRTMVKYMTATELAFMREVYSTKTGRSVMRKVGSWPRRALRIRSAGG